MKKLITLIALLLLPFAAGYAQEDREPVYFYVTSKGEGGVTEGFSRNRSSKKLPTHNDYSVHFIYKSENKNVEVIFSHIDYNTYELSKKRPVEWDDTL